MVPIHFAVGSKVFVRREGMVHPAYIVGFLHRRVWCGFKLTARIPHLWNERTYFRNRKKRWRDVFRSGKRS